MKAYNVKEMLYQSPDGSHCIYRAENDVILWDVTIDAGIGDEVYIAHLSDLHYNYCNNRILRKPIPY